VIELMRDKGISQVPVKDANGWIQGIVTEGALLTALYEKRARADETVEKLVAGTVEMVTPSDSIELVSKLLAAGKTPLVTESHSSGKVLAILTKIDLLAHLATRH
jgi:predicted transcriptional regulator